MTRKIVAHNSVRPIYILYFSKSFIFKDAQDIITVTLDDISTSVFTVARGTLSLEPQYAKSPSGAAILRNTYAENNPPNNKNILLMK